jgi:hypothetical protein
MYIDSFQGTVDDIISGIESNMLPGMSWDGFLDASGVQYLYGYISEAMSVVRKYPADAIAAGHWTIQDPYGKCRGKIMVADADALRELHYNKLQPVWLFQDARDKAAAAAAAEFAQAAKNADFDALLADILG